MCMFRDRLPLIIMLLIAMCQQPSVMAETQSVTLASGYADFALNPETGTIAAVDASRNEAVFYRLESQSGGMAKPDTTARVGSTPCSVFYKRFGEKRVFAVVCTQDSHLYLFQADGSKKSVEDFQLLKKISLDVTGLSSVFGSINPEDPFVYYCYGGGHDSACGVVSLRDMKNYGVAFDDAMDGAVSATGEFAYRRGPWSPSGFESLRMVNDFQAEKPNFNRWFYDHRSAGEYLPDPLGRMTICGNAIHDVSLEKQLGSLNFQAQAFCLSPLMIVGFANGKIQACSYNSLTKFGTPVPFSLADTQNSELPRGVAAQADFKRVQTRTRMLVDQKRKRIAVGTSNRILIVPIADLEVPDEPLLVAALSSSKTLIVDQKVKLSVEPLDPRVQVTIDDPPLGAVVDGSSMTWTPTADQVGPVNIAVTLKHGDQQSSQILTCRVGHPSISLPFSAQGMALSPDSKQIVIWETHGTDAIGRPIQTENRTTFKVALVDVSTGQVLAQRQVAEAPANILYHEKNLILVPPRMGSSKCEILDVKTLERTKSLVVSGPIQTIQLYKSKLVVSTPNSVEFYDSTSLAKVKVIAGTGNVVPGLASLAVLTPEGIAVNGMVLDDQLRPVLLRQAPAPVTRITQGLENSRFQPSDMARPQNVQQSGISQLSSSGVTVTLDQRISTIQVPGSIHTQRQQVELKAVASGPVDETQVLLRDFILNQEQPVPILLAVSTDTAFVTRGKTMVSWKFPSPVAKSLPLRLSQKQSALTLADGKTTNLEHKATGGQGPISYSLRFPIPGATIDEKTGTISIDNAEITGKIMEQLSQDYANAGAHPSQNIPSQQIVSELLGRKITGSPLSIPIGVTATDADLASDQLTYYLIFEVPQAQLNAIRDQLQKMEQEQQARMAKQERMNRLKTNPIPPMGEAEEDELDRLRRKVEALEGRIDLLTNQLNQLIKQQKP